MYAIESKFTHSEIDVVYSELIVKSNEDIKIKTIRTNFINNKEVRQSSHILKANLKAGMKYQVSTSIENNELNVWIINSATLGVVSTVSTINTVFEKVFTLKDITKNQVKRIKIILKNKQEKIANLRVINKKKPRYAWD